MKNKTILYSFLLMLISGCSHKWVYTTKLPEGHTRGQHDARSKDYMISTQGKYATIAGKKMFDLGGNAFDAFAAISFVISVERPQSTGLGGGGFLVYYSTKMDRPESVDFREMAPSLGHAKMFLDKTGQEIPRKSLDGIHAGGVPGLVAGVLEVHQKFGKLPLKVVLEPAIELARKGFKVYPHLANAIMKRIEVLKKYPASAQIFLHPNGDPLKEGDWIIQEDLAKTIELIAKGGRNGFYEGKTASAIISEMKLRGGLMRQKDLSGYKVKWRPAVHTSFRGHDIYSMGPPSSGGIHIVQILNILEADNLAMNSPHSPKNIHLVTSAMQLAFADRAKYLGDADYVSVPVKGLTAKDYAKKLREKINENSANRSSDINAGDPIRYESPETTHFTIIDKDNNVLASTQTINGYLGSGLVIPGTGVVLNNEMDDFATKPGASNLFGVIGSDKNLVSPGKRPLSSMSPTIVFRDEKPILALGTPSGSQILTCVAQTILNYLVYDMDLYEAVSARRYHHQWRPDYIRLEEGFPYRVQRQLKNLGHDVQIKPIGCKVQAIAVEDGVLHGVSDPRGEGMSYGPPKSQF